MLPVFLLIIGVLLTVLVSTVVLLNNPKARTSRTLFCIAVSLVVWEITNYLADQPGDLTLWWNRASFIGPLFVFLFSSYFVNALANKPHNKSTESIYVVVTTLVATICLHDTVITNVEPRIVQGIIEGYNVTRGVGYYVVLTWITILIARFLHNLVSSFLHTTGQTRQQFQLVIAGVVIAVAAGLTTNVVLPIVTGDTTAAQFAPIAGIVFTSFLAVAIVKHGLFNIKLLVIRALAYVLSMLVISALYGFSAFGIATYVFRLDIPIASQMYLSAATGIAALAFYKIKRFFDKVSRKLFYQDAYDPEVLFDDYNKTLVSTIDLELLLSRTTKVISDYLKADYCTVGIKDGSDGVYRVIGTGKRILTSPDIKTIQEATRHTRRAVINTDNLQPEHDSLLTVLTKYDIALLLKLTPNLTGSQGDVGYLVLGSKKSGNPYTSQDIKVIEALANELAIALQNALRFEEIERFNETLQQEIEEATRQLRESNKKLKDLNESKDEFISMTSHQLRTPLTSIKGYISLVMDGDAGRITAAQHKLLGQAYSSSQKMVYLIADLLNVSRLQTGKFIVERKPTDLVALIKGEIDQLQEEAETRGLDLTYDPPKKFPIVNIDDTKTRQVVMNFLDNAMYYTSSGGHIHVELKELPQSIEFRVIDDGIGVPKAERHHLFSKFYRAKNAQRSRPDGTGLGLYMSRKVVTAQGGAVIFESDEGKGSTFGFSLPKHPAKVSR